MNRRVTPEQLAQAVVERFELDYDLLAAKIVARLERPAQASQLVSAKEIAQQLGRTARWVRERKEELGAVPMSDGPRPRLGFDPAYVERRTQQDAVAAREKKRRLLRRQREAA